MLEQNIAAADRTLRRIKPMDSPEAIHDYFDFLYYMLTDEKRRDEKEILPAAAELKFATVSAAFHLIDDADYTIYIPVGDGVGLIERLRRCGPDRSLLRQLGSYSVGVYREYFDRLYTSGRLEKITETAGILLDLTLYSDRTGLPFEVVERAEAIFV